MTEPLLRPMRLADLPPVMEIDRQSLPRPWSEAVWREELRSLFGLYLVLEEGGLVSGHIGVRDVADEAHVMTLAVHPERRRRGFGRPLEAALADPALLSARPVSTWKCVRATPPPARSTTLWASTRRAFVPTTTATRTRCS